MTLTLKHIRSYGNDRYYPACKTSSVLCELLGRKSLTADQVNILKRAFDIEVKNEKIV
mgnify:FL=1